MKTINGDLLEIKSGLLLHQVNCLGITGGLAGALRRKWPKAFDGYRRNCSLSGADNLGSCLIEDPRTSISPSLFICHIFGQVRPGPNTNINAVDSALDALRFEMRKAWASGVQVYAPHMMGCSLGGGDWSEYSKLLEKHFPDIIIVKKY